MRKSDALFAVLLVLLAIAGLGMIHLALFHSGMFRPVPIVGEIFKTTESNPFEVEYRYARVIAVKDGWVQHRDIEVDQDGKTGLKLTWNDTLEQFDYEYPTPAPAGTPMPQESP